MTLNRASRALAEQWLEADVPLKPWMFRHGSTGELRTYGYGFPSEDFSVSD